MTKSAKHTEGKMDMECSCYFGYGNPIEYCSLHSSAKELLGACQVVLDSLNGVGTSLDDGGRRAILRQAIAKAEGRA